MEGKGPYRIYDPGGSEVKARDEAGGGSSYRQLLEENSMLRERMKGLKSLGMFLKTSYLKLKLRPCVCVSVCVSILFNPWGCGVCSLCLDPLPEAWKFESSVQYLGLHSSGQ